MNTGVEQKYVEILKHLDTPAICNAIEAYKVRPQNEGFMHPSIKALFPELEPAVGHAVTLTVRTRQEGHTTPAYADLGRHVEAILTIPEPRILVIQDLDDDPLGSPAGEMVCSLYSAFGVVGLVTNGSIRDTQALRRRRFPVFAAGRCCSHAFGQHLDMNVPVQVGGVTISPGDLLHGDADGVTSIPLSLVREVALLGKKLLEVEDGFFSYVDSGKATIEGVSEVHAKTNTFYESAIKEISRELAQNE